MKLRKVEWWEAPKARPKASPAPSQSVLTVVPTHTKEVLRETVLEKAVGLEDLRQEVEKLKKRRPEYVGGSGSVGSYHQVTSNNFRFTKSSFQPGINVIGVQNETGATLTIWLPKDLEPNHLIAVKDELGVAAQHSISIQVYT